MDVLRGVAAIVFTFSVAIFVHELGHFLFAKLFRVHVETFSLGFGKKLWKRRWGPTEYCISAVPFGGYVKLKGMHSKAIEEYLESDAKDDGAEAGTDAQKPRETMSETVVEEMAALRAKPYWQKVLIFGAGCMNNFLTAVLIYFLMAWIGFHRAERPKPLIDKIDVVDAAKVGLKPGDLVLQVGGKPVDNYDKFLTAFVTQAEKAEKAGKTATLAVGVERNGTTQTVQVPLWPDPDLVQPGESLLAVEGKPVKSVKEAALLAQMKLGGEDTIEVTVSRDGIAEKHVVPPYAALGYYWPEVAILPRQAPFIAAVIPNLPAEKAGIRSRDTIVSVDGKPVETLSEATDLLRAAVGRTIPIEVRRGDEKRGYEVVKVQTEVRPDPEFPKRGQIGIAWGSPPTGYHKLPAGAALKEAFSRAFFGSVFYLTELRNLFRKSFQTVRENVGGPIAIATMSYKAAQEGVMWFIEMFAMFNIVLAVMNLLPLPVLDGGHILFATIETITRRPLPAPVMIRIYNVFIVIIIGLAILLTFNDVIMNAWRLMP